MECFEHSCIVNVGLDWREMEQPAMIKNELMISLKLGNLSHLSHVTIMDTITSNIEYQKYAMTCYSII